jgi:hypothetical protein
MPITPVTCPLDCADACGMLVESDERGRFVPRLSYSYTFDLQEMKSPLISAVTGAGWRWRPTVWQGPQWLRWLTH